MAEYRAPTARERASVRRLGARRANAPQVVGVRFDAGRDRIVLELNRDCAIAFSPTIYPALAQASPSELGVIEILGPGSAILFPQIDVSISVENLIADLMASAPRDRHQPTAVGT